ncbi:hypothetical protein VNO77_30467 [Canavalia gladiata]|uniref:RNase H type-1 domain-containing protein n=1 Tax=Canavalia gladiata TaxID=3824 RepID=A0AAN9KN51_CANGL
MDRVYRSLEILHSQSPHKATCFRGLFCDKDGKCLSNFYGNIGSPHLFRTELISLITNLRLAWNEGSLRLLYYFDCKEFVCLVEEGNTTFHEYKSNITTIRSWLSKSCRVILSHMLHEDNSSADTIAKLGAQQANDLGYSEHASSKNQPQPLLG